MWYNRLPRYAKVAVFLLAMTSCCGAGKTVRFAIASDFHAQDVPDGEKRLKTFIDAATREKVDFIIELGDFCRLDEGSKCFRDLWLRFPGERYHVIGNHDMDKYTADEYVKGMEMPGRYYSFDKGDFHFIVLDGNNLFDGQNYKHYERANYYVDARKRAFVDPEQMEWLKKDLAATDKRCVLFSHQSIDYAMGNREEVRKVLEEANRQAGFQKVVVAFSGHNHSNYEVEINGITYIQINSASYVWIDKPSMTEKRYPEEVNKKFPLLQYSITYDRPLFGMVTLNQKGMKMKGSAGNFLPPTPQELNMPDSLGVLPLVPDIKDAEVRFK